MDTKTRNGTNLKANGDEQVFSPEQLADYLGIGRTFAYQLLAQKCIPSFTIGH
ncbi:MAG: helix-turn-helix domain-containing protein [Chloroflexota bacterium]|nr:helix-turn-helix domain-containing protein [Chloroflexota bacterium]